MQAVMLQIEDNALREALALALQKAGVETTDRCPPGSEGVPVLVLAADETESFASRLQSTAGGWRVEPAVVVVGPAPLSQADFAAAGADAVVVWPQERELLGLVVRAVLEKRARRLDCHPLTGLPGGAALHRAMETGLAEPGRLAILTFDIRDFKPYNDRYGFLRGDSLIRAVADMLEEVAAGRGMVFHVGGDDLAVVTVPEQADDIALQAIRAFDEALASWVGAEDSRRGSLPGLSRATGEPLRCPLPALTVCCVTNEPGDLNHPGQLARVLAELKADARRSPGSSYERDRRRVHDVAASLALRRLQEGRGATEHE